MFSLAGKTAVVTGGGKGIGRGIVLALARSGADVVLTGRTASALEQTAQEAEAYGVKTLCIPADITHAEGLQRIVDETLAKFGHIDSWINNAGSASPKDVGPLLDTTEQQWDNVVDLNLKWTFFAAQAAARAMTRGGSIINISSRSGSQPCPMTGQYGAAKAGIENLTATMAVEWGHLGIRVNAIAPGVIQTETTTSMTTDSRIRRQIESVPLRRLGTIDDIGPLCVYFAADESSFTTGTVVPVHGGSRVTVGYMTYLHKVNAKLAAAAVADAS